MAFFKKAHLPPSLQSITLALAVRVAAVWSDNVLRRSNISSPLSLPPWSELDRKVSRLPTVQWLEIMYAEEGATHDDTDPTWVRFDEVAARVLEVLPLCAARGIVTQFVVARAQI